MIRNKILQIIFALAAILVSSCNNDETPCASADEVNNPSCKKQIPDINSRPLSLSINYKDSFYYDQNTKKWKTIQRDRLLGGTTGETLLIYSNFLNIPLESALSSVANASNQVERPEEFTVSSYNRIPYVELIAEDGAEYLFDYVKKDLNNNVIFEKVSTVPVINGRVILPLVNAIFDDQFYPSDSNVGSRFIHSLSFAAQSKTKKGAISTNIDFETSFQIPPTDFLVGYSTEINSFTLDNRWKSYFKDRDYSPNTDFPFFTLKELKEKSEQIPLDIKYVFQSPPELKIEQELFFELPFDYDTFVDSGEIIPLRGSRFYSKKIQLSSNTDFKMKSKINSTQISISNGKELEYLNLPAGTPWDVSFFYDFTQNQGYPINPQTGAGLLTPLKPICHELSKKQYNPIKEETEKKAAIANNGYIAICHPVINKKAVIAPDVLSTLSLQDTWFNFFSYVPYNPFKKELGHFYGIKKVRFFSEGCVRVYTREVGTSSYILKSKGSAKCNPTPGDTADNGWVSFYAEKTVTIFDNISSYDSIDGLKPLLQTFSTKPTITDYDNFWFNGFKNDVRHIF